MPHVPFLLVWLAGTLLPLAALWLLWRLALRGERCFGYNRVLLLLAPVVAAGWPLLPRPEWLGAAVLVPVPTAVAPVVALPEVAAASPVAASGWAVWPWLLALYGAGVAVGLGRLAYQCWRLHQAARRLPREKRPGYELACTGGRLPTSSFGRTVFWDETAALAPTEAASVLAHELAHVRQGHTYDVLWLGVWRAVLWPNPVAHLLLPALRLTHELLADRTAAGASHAAAGAPAPAAYEVLLARLAAQRLASPAAYSLLHPFTFSFTLTRIAMLQNHHPVRRWKQWLVVPLLSGVFFTVGRSVSAQSATSAPETPEQEIKRKLTAAMHADAQRTGGKIGADTAQYFSVTNLDKPGQVKVVITRVKATPPPQDTPAQAAPGAPAPPKVVPKGQQDTKQEEGKVYTYVEQMPQPAGGGGVGAIVKQIQDNFVYPTGPRQEGRVFASFTVKADGSVSDTRIVKGLAPAYDEAVLAAIKKLPRFEPGVQSGQPVAVNFTVPILFKDKP